MNAVYSPVKVVVTTVGGLILKIFGAFRQAVGSVLGIFPKILMPSYGRVEESREETPSLNKESDVETEFDNEQPTEEVPVPVPTDGLEKRASCKSSRKSLKSVSEERIPITRSTRSGKVYYSYI